MSDSNTKDQSSLKVHVSPDLEYCYRDVANIFIGPRSSEVVFEWGNRHLSLPGNVTIYNRLVMSFADAYDFHQRLGKTLMNTQQKLQAQLSQSVQEAKKEK